MVFYTLPPITNFASASFNLFNHDDDIFLLLARNRETDDWGSVVNESREDFSLFLSAISFFLAWQCS